MEDDLSGIYGQPGAQVMQTPDVEFTEADGQQLRGLQNGLARLDQQAYSGQIEPEKALEIKQQVAPRLGQLKQKQQVAQQQQQSQLQQAAMQQSAAQESINQVHLKARAEGFPQTVATLVHEMSGHIAHFYQDKMGSWSQVDWSKAAPEQPEASENYFPGAQPGLGMGVAQPEDTGDAGWSVKPDVPAPMTQYQREPIYGRGGVIGYRDTTVPAFTAAEGERSAETPNQPSSEFEGSTGEPTAQGTPTVAQQAAPVQTPPGPSAPPAPMRHVMTIQNGDHIQKFAFNPNGTLETIADNRPSSTESGQSGFDTSEVSRAMKLASDQLNATFGPLPSRPQMPGPLAYKMWAQAQQERETHISTLGREILSQSDKGKRQAAQQAYHTQGAATAQSGKEDLLSKRQAGQIESLQHKGETASRLIADAAKLTAGGAMSFDDAMKKVQAIHQQHGSLGAVQPAAAPQGSSMAPSAQDFINSQLK